MKLIGVINTGSTSTKLAVYGYEEKSSSLKDIKEIDRNIIEVKDVSNVYKDFEKDYKIRKETIKEYFRKFLKIKESSRFVCFAARGGLLRPLKGGVYRIDEKMVDDLLECRYGNHPSNMAAPIAYEIAKSLGIESVIAYPVVTDEMDDMAKFTGMPEIKRKSIFHALNHKSVARYLSEKLGKNYKDLKIIVCHMGGGITVGIHVNGKVVDVNNGLDGDGPFAVDRAGSLPPGDLVKICFEGNYNKKEIESKIVGNAGIFAYLGTKDARLLEEVIQNNTEKMGINPNEARIIVNAWAYAVSKEICSLAAYSSGMVDAIILTGGLAYFKYFVDQIEKRVSFLAKIVEYPGENELKSLAEYAFLALIGREEIYNYGS